MNRVDETTRNFVDNYARRAGLTKGQIQRARAAGLMLRRLERKTGMKVKMSDEMVAKILNPEKP